jgi:hypothetical protein
MRRVLGMRKSAHRRLEWKQHLDSGIASQLQPYAGEVEELIDNRLVSTLGLNGLVELNAQYNRALAIIEQLLVL